MKKVVAILLLAIFIAVGAYAEGIEGIMPDASVWGMSAENIKVLNVANYRDCEVNGDDALCVSNVEVCSYDMDVYYVFGDEVNNSDGTAYAGLSKIAYILNVSDFNTESELDSCLLNLAEEIKRIEGEPDTEKNGTQIWKNEKYKIELGKGKLAKYTGSDSATVAVIFKRGSSPKQTKAPKSTKEPTMGESNALASALRYLDFMAFSRNGLIEQLEYEGYSHSEAEYAVNNCGANWNEQAAKKAKEYLEYTSFSRQGLIEQLEYEGFTHDQALYGVKAVGY